MAGDASVVTLFVVTILSSTAALVVSLVAMYRLCTRGRSRFNYNNHIAFTFFDELLRCFIPRNVSCRLNSAMRPGSTPVWTAPTKAQSPAPQALTSQNDNPAKKDDNPTKKEDNPTKKDDNPAKEEDPVKKEEPTKNEEPAKKEENSKKEENQKKEEDIMKQQSEKQL